MDNWKMRFMSVSVKCLRTLDADWLVLKMAHCAVAELIYFFYVNVPSFEIWFLCWLIL